MDREKKLKISIAVTIVMAVLLLGGMVAGWAMMLVRPLTAKLAEAETKKQAAKTEADTLKASKQRLAEATQKAAVLKAQLAFYRKRYEGFDYGKWEPKQRPASFTTESLREWLKYQELTNNTWKRYMRYFSYNLVPTMQGEIQGAAESAGVRLIQWGALTTKPPPKGPENLTFPDIGLIFKPVTDTPLPIQVRGSLTDVEEFLTRIHQGKFLILVTGPIKFEGSSASEITATFAIHPLVMAHGDKVPMKSSGVATTAAAAATGAGATASSVISAVANATPVGGATATTTGP